MLRASRGPLERRRDELVRLGHDLRELASTNVVGACRLGESRADAPKRFLVGRRERGLGEQRMDEANRSVRLVHDRVGDCGAQRSSRVRDSRVYERLHRRVDRSGGVQKCRARPGREAADSIGGQGGEGCRHRKGYSRVELGTRPTERLRDLERVERVAYRRALDLDEDQPGERAAEPSDEQTVEGRERQGTDLEPFQCAGWESGLEPQRVLTRPASGREENADPGAEKSPCGEREDPRRALVKPLHVVDRDQDRGVRLERAEQVQGRDGERTLVDADAFRLCAQKCDLERPSLRIRELRKQLRRDSGEQVTEATERELRLRARRPGREHTESALLRRGDGAVP